MKQKTNAHFWKTQTPDERFSGKYCQNTPTLGLFCLKAFLIIGLFLLALPFSFAKSTVLYNHTFDTTQNFTLNGCTITTTGKQINCGTGLAKAFYINKLINLSENTNSYTIKFYKFATVTTSASTIMRFDTENSTSPFNLQLAGTGGAGIYMYDIDTNSIADFRITGFDNTNFSLTLSFLRNNSINVSVNDTFKFNFPKIGGDNNVTFMAFWTDTGTQVAVSDGFVVYNGTTTEIADGTAAAEGNITFTAADSYDSSINLVNFSVVLSNAANNQTFSTVNGTISIINITEGFFNLTFISGANGSYFNTTYLNINISKQNFKGNLTQSYLSLNVTDLLSGIGLSAFTVNTNFSTHSGTSGYILLPSRAGYHVFNITSSQYSLAEFSYSISALENLSFTANVSSRFQFYLRREADNSVFDVNATNTTRLTIFCPTKNIIIYFKNESSGSSPTSKVSTQENITMDCPYTLMKMDINYPDSSYFRSLIPATTQQNVTWWLLDLNKDTGVQIILELIDLSGDFTGGKITIKTAIGSKNEEIVVQKFDIATSVVLYLLKDALYKVTLTSTDGTIIRELGDLIADAAGTKTITYPTIPFYPDTILENNITWSYTFNASANILRLQFLDSTGQTTHIRWRIYNGTNGSTILSTFENFYTTTNFSSVTYTYQPVLFNFTYYTHLFVEHSTLGFNISEYRIFGDFESPGGFAGFETDSIANIKKYSSAMFLVVWGLLFSARHAGIGMTSTFIWLVILRQIGWFLIGWGWVSLIGLLVGIGWIFEYMRRN